MFSPQQKKEIAAKVQHAIQQTLNDELPVGEVNFILHVDGADPISWANIRNSSARDVPVPDVLVQNMSASNTARTRQERGWDCATCGYSNPSSSPICTHCRSPRSGG
jgi:hypothetical protein